MAITTTQSPPAGDIPLLPTWEATPGSFQILPAVAVFIALHRDLTSRRVIPVHHGHRAPVILLLRIPLQAHHIQVAIQAAVAAAVEGDNTI
jgi:hypothetical protein